MTVASKKLFFGTAPSGPTTCYTVPSGHVTIVKNILLMNNGGGSDALAVVSAKDVSGLEAWVHSVSLFPAQAISNADRWFVLEAGDSLRIFSTTGSTAFRLSGAELTIP